MVLSAMHRARARAGAGLVVSENCVDWKKKNEEQNDSSQLSTKSDISEPWYTSTYRLAPS